jgi:hypothetical protein
MGLLDDLKQQAETLRKEQESGRTAQLQNSQAMQSGLREARRYLTELASSLNIIKPPVYRSYHLDAANKLDQLEQCEYKVREKQRTFEQKDYLEEVAFLFRCVGAHDLTIEKSSAQSVNRLREFLWSYNMRFDCREWKGERGLLERATFTVFADVPATAVFAGDWDTGKITLTLKNVERPGEAAFQYDAVELNPALFEELAKLLLGKPNRFRNLGGHQQMMQSMPRSQATAGGDAPAGTATIPAGPAGISGPKGGVLGFVNALLKK